MDKQQRFMRNKSGKRLAIFGYGVIEPEQAIAVHDDFNNQDFVEVKAEPLYQQKEQEQPKTETESVPKKK